MNMIFKKSSLLVFLFLLAVATTSFAQQTSPKDPITQLYALLQKKDNKLYKEWDCLQLDGLDLIKADQNCLTKHLAYLKETGIFSTAYLQSLKKEYDSWKKDPALFGRDSDIYFMNQDPAPIQSYITALQKAKVTKKNNDTNIITITLPKPDSSKLVYKVVLEKGTWKIDSWSI